VSAGWDAARSGRIAARTTDQACFPCPPVRPRVVDRLERSGHARRSREFTDQELATIARWRVATRAAWSR